MKRRTFLAGVFGAAATPLLSPLAAVAAPTKKIVFSNLIDASTGKPLSVDVPGDMGHYGQVSWTGRDLGVVLNSDWMVRVG